MTDEEQQGLGCVYYCFYPHTDCAGEFECCTDAQRLFNLKKKVSLLCLTNAAIGEYLDSVETLFC